MIINSNAIFDFVRMLKEKLTKLLYIIPYYDVKENEIFSRNSVFQEVQARRLFRRLPVRCLMHFPFIFIASV